MSYPNTTFPTTLDNPTNPVATDTVATFDHAGLETFQNNAIKAVETLVGVSGSAVNTTHDYKLSGVTTGDKAVSKTGTETLTNKTITSPVITGATITTSTIPESNVTFTDITTGNVSTSNHGFVPKAPNSTSQFLRGDATWASVPGGTAVTIITASTTTLSMTTNGSQKVVVYAKGDATSTGSSSDVPVLLKYNSVTKDTVNTNNTSAGNFMKFPFSLMYTETPANGTQSITVTSAATLANVVIIAFILG